MHHSCELCIKFKYFSYLGCLSAEYCDGLVVSKTKNKLGVNNHLQYVCTFSQGIVTHAVHLVPCLNDVRFYE